MKRINTSSLFVVALLVIGVLTPALPVAAADTPGIWKLTGSMTINRRHANRERLPDGRILVVGGSNTTGVDGSASVFYGEAEIYDPATGTWTATGSLTTGGGPLLTTSVLPNGKILAAGGWNGFNAFSSAGIYDPATGTWSPTGSMTVARAQHRALDLYDGRILVTGGFDSLGNPLNSAEIYDPATGTWTATTASMASPRTAHRMNSVGAGKVLITGGFGAGGTALASAELFDPTTGTFTATGSMAQARGHHYATTLPTGEIFVTGGHGGGGVLGSTELYDPDTGTFTAGATLNQARQSHSSSLLPNGLVLISGGNTSSSADWDIQTNFLSSAELYDRKTNTFTPTGSKNTAASSSAGFLLWTGKFLSAGGGTNQAELYNPLMPGTSETWVATTGNLVAARTSHQQTLLDDGRVLMTGGLPDAIDTSIPLKSAELYDYLTGNFTATGDMTIARQQHRSALLYTGKVLVTGGRPFADTTVINALNSAELFDPVAGTFSATGNMQRYRRLHRATNLADGKVLITGGVGGQAANSNLLPSLVELYDPETGTFTAVSSLNHVRRNHQAILLHTGKVLIAGGFTSFGALAATAELYDPATRIFTDTGIMITSRANPNLTRLPNGKIFVSGGTDAVDEPILSLEIYDPATETFTAAGNMSVARDGRTTRLDNGKLAIVGGRRPSPGDDGVRTVELYSQVTGTVSATGNLITGRKDHSQTSLPNGQILVAGGLSDTDYALPSAELYTPLIGDEVDTTITSGPAALTTSTSATFNFTSTPAGGTFTCSRDGSPFTTCASGQGYELLADGIHNFQVHATDALGNTDPTPANHNWTVDTTPPVASINTGPAGDPGGATNSTSATFNFTSNEPVSAYACSLDGAAFATCTSPKAYTKLKTGNHTFQVYSTDLAGNVGGPTSFNWTIDTKAPNTTIASFPPALTNNPVATFEFYSTEPGGTYQCSLDGGAFAPCTSPFTTDPLEDGKHSFQVKAVDAAGNIDKSAAKAKAWTVDATPPVTNITGKPTDPTTSANVAFKFSSEKKSTFICSLDGGPFEACKSGKKYSALLPGLHNFQVQATDAAKNVELIPASYSWTQN